MTIQDAVDLIEIIRKNNNKLVKVKKGSDKEQKLIKENRLVWEKLQDLSHEESMQYGSEPLFKVGKIHYHNFKSEECCCSSVKQKGMYTYSLVSKHETKYDYPHDYKTTLKAAKELLKDFKNDVDFKDTEFTVKIYKDYEFVEDLEG